MKYSVIAYVLSAIIAIAVIVAINPPGTAFWSIFAGMLLYPIMLLSEKTAYTLCEFLTILAIFGACIGAFCIL